VTRRSTSIVAAAAIAITAASVARADDRRAESAARDAFERARAELEAKAYDKAVTRLQKIARACGASGCRATTLGSVLRDLGVAQVLRGDADGAARSFAQALALAPELALPSYYDTPDVRVEWEAAKDEASLVGAEQPSGELAHTPAAEQAVGTPLPVFVAERGEGAIARVVVKYRTTGATEHRTATLERVDGGWGGLVPCADVVRGVVRYYLQGFDASGSPVALSGTPKRPYFVPIRRVIASPPPALPGHPPPARCDAPPASRDEPSTSGDRCVDDSQCEGGTCHQGACVSRPEEPAREGGYRRWWIGLGASIDATPLPTATDVCKLTAGGAPQNAAGYYCTTPGGADFPARRGSAENDSLASGSAGAVSRKIVAGDVRVTVSVDYALTASLLVGGRLGYVARSYDGEAASDDGRALALPIHVEAHAVYLFGDEPLARTGFAPFVLAAAGVGAFDASATVTVQRTGIAGDRTMRAWITGGPWFVALGAGGRYALSPRVAALAGLRMTGAFGGGGLLPFVSPELSVHYGF
jgi:hypothetical protein